MSAIENNKQIVVAFLNKVFNEHKVDEGISLYMAPKYTQHNPGVGDDVEAFRLFFRKFFAERPQASFDIKRVFCEGDFVTIHAHWRDFPKDRGQAVMDIFRVENGKVAEHWDVMQPVPEVLAHNNTMF